MKRLFIIITVIFPLFSFAQEESIFDIVRKGVYSFEPIHISSSTINSFSNNLNLQADGYYFRFNIDSLSSYVPYVGTMTNAPVPDASTNAIIIESKVENYKIKEISHGRKLNITFDVYSNYSNELFKVILLVTESGSADVMFRSSRRAYISFLGEIR